MTGDERPAWRISPATHLPPVACPVPLSGRVAGSPVKAVPCLARAREKALFAELASSGSAGLCLLPRGVALPTPEKLLEKASRGEEGEPSRRAPVRFLPPVLAAVAALGAFACLERPRSPRGVFGWRASNPGRLAFRLSRERVQGEPKVRLALHQE